MQGPPVGLDIGDFDSGDLFRGNASAGNEQGGKLQGVLQYLHMFEENSITDLLGYRHTVLSRKQGGLEGGTGGCLKPVFYVGKNDQIRVYFRPAYLLLPGGDSGGLIPVTPKFQGVDLDKPMDPEEGDGKGLSDGEYGAWLKLDGYDAEITVKGADEDPPKPPESVNDGVVWNIAKWSIEGSEIVDGEYYACPFLPATDNTTHSFYPTLYQSNNKIPGDGGQSQWSMKVYYGSIHDLHTGDHYKVERCDNKTEISVSYGQDWYLEVKTDNSGVPTSFKITETEPEVEPFQPPEGGVTSSREGTYKWKLFSIESGGGGKLVPRIFHSGDISWYRWLHDNLTYQAENKGRVYKQFNTDNYKHEFRHIVGGGATKVYEQGNSILIYTPPYYSYNTFGNPQ